MSTSTFQKGRNSDWRGKHAALSYQPLLLSELESLSQDQQDNGTTLILPKRQNCDTRRVCFPHIFSTLPSVCNQTNKTSSCNNQWEESESSGGVAEGKEEGGYSEVP